MLIVVCGQETCWKPYLSGRNQLQTDNSDNGHRDDDDDDYNCDSEIEAAICDCLRRYLQHSVSVSSNFILCTITLSNVCILHFFMIVLCYFP